jgi:hypothetical protein
LFPPGFDKAAAYTTTPSGGIGQEDFLGLGNFADLQEKSGYVDWRIWEVY